MSGGLELGQHASDGGVLLVALLAEVELGVGAQDEGQATDLARGDVADRHEEHVGVSVPVGEERLGRCSEVLQPLLDSREKRLHHVGVLETLIVEDAALQQVGEREALPLLEVVGAKTGVAPERGPECPGDPRCPKNHHLGKVVGIDGVRGSGKPQERAEGFGVGLLGCGEVGVVPAEVSR